MTREEFGEMRWKTKRKRANPERAARILKRLLNANFCEDLDHSL